MLNHNIKKYYYHQQYDIVHHIKIHIVHDNVTQTQWIIIYNAHYYADQEKV